MFNYQYIINNVYYLEAHYQYLTENIKQKVGWQIKWWAEPHSLDKLMPTGCGLILLKVGSFNKNQHAENSCFITQTHTYMQNFKIFTQK